MYTSGRLVWLGSVGVVVVVNTKTVCGFFFFFQAEDGIRDWSVTGVQTCALPICLDMVLRLIVGVACLMSFVCNIGLEEVRDIPLCEIGRASCRERV